MDKVFRAWMKDLPSGTTLLQTELDGLPDKYKKFLWHHDLLIKEHLTEYFYEDCHEGGCSLDIRYDAEGRPFVTCPDSRCISLHYLSEQDTIGYRFDWHKFTQLLYNANDLQQLSDASYADWGFHIIGKNDTKTEMLVFYFGRKDKLQNYAEYLRFRLGKSHTLKILCVDQIYDTQIKTALRHHQCQLYSVEQIVTDDSFMLASERGEEK